MAARGLIYRSGVVAVVLLAGLSKVGVAQSSPLGVLDLTVTVELSCPSCAAGLERRLSRLDSVASVEIKSEEDQVVVTPVSEAALDVAAVREVIRNAGFEPSAMTVSAIGRVIAVRDGHALELAGASLMPLASDERTDALVAEAMGATVTVTGQSTARPDGRDMLHVETFEVR